MAVVAMVHAVAVFLLLGAATWRPRTAALWLLVIAVDLVAAGLCWWRRRAGPVAFAAVCAAVAVRSLVGAAALSERRTALVVFAAVHVALALLTTATVLRRPRPARS